MSASTPASATPQSRPEGDGEVAEFVQMDVRMDKRIGGAGIEVRVNDGIACLTGEVGSLAQAERATARAIANPAVRAVVNRLTVRPRSGEAILKDATAALAGQKMIDADRIKVSVTGFRITLTGSVANGTGKELAREIISGVPGAVAVGNELVETGDAPAVDERLAEQLRFIIRRDPLCEGLDLAVGVKSGSVEIRGEVGSSGEIGRLMRRCHVDGVKSFRTTHLRVNRDLAMEGLADKEYSTDESIAAMRAAFQSDPGIRNGDIRVAMDDGVVTLSGNVAAAVDHDVAEVTARGIPGVQQVVNELGISRELAGKRQDIRAASPPLVQPPR